MIRISRLETNPDILRIETGAGVQYLSGEAMRDPDSPIEYHMLYDLALHIESMPQVAAVEAVGWQRRYKYGDGSNGPWCSVTKESYDETISGKWAHKYDVRELYAAAQEAVVGVIDDMKIHHDGSGYVAVCWQRVPDGFKLGQAACVVAPIAAAPVASAVLTNPYTGQPRDYRDVESDPAGTLIVEPGKPLEAASTPAAPGIDLTPFREAVLAQYEYDEVNAGGPSAAEVMTRAAERRDRLLALIDASPKGVTFHNDGNNEAQFIADSERLDCPACGGSGHIDDSPKGGDERTRFEAWAKKHHRLNYPGYYLARHALSGAYCIQVTNTAWEAWQAALQATSPKGGSDAVAELAAAAEGVLWFDWSDNDSDAVASIERLRNSLDRMQVTSAEVKP